MATGARVDPYSAFLFHVEIGGVDYGMFRECSGLSSEINIQENPEGGTLVTGKLPGRVKYTNITLKWGLTDDRTLYDWHRAGIDGPPLRKNGSIVLYDRSGREKVRWNFVQGWPSKWEGPHFNAASDEMAIQTLEIAHEGIVQA
jgi:phage tail-like protein